MQILVPISSHSSFFPTEDFYFPKPLIEVAGRPMIEVVVGQLERQFKKPEFTFVIEREVARAFSLDQTLKLAAGEGATVVERAGETSGALCSCMLAVDYLKLDSPLLITNSDQIISGEISHLIDDFPSETAAGVITFDSIHPRWSYVISNETAEVLQSFEKKVVSRHAIAGIFYFRTAQIFIEAAQRVILNDVNINGNFFISATINEILLSGGLVKHAPIDSRDFHSFYAPSRITAFERTTLAASLRRREPAIDNLSVVIPAAGDGSRFAQAGWTQPKPFIDVNGYPMLNHVIENLVPEEATATVLLRQDHISSSPATIEQIKKTGVSIQTIDNLTEGTACTVLLARRVFDNDHPLLIGNSDQIVDFDVRSFIGDCLERGLDGSMVIFKDSSRSPKWSFAKLNSEGLVVEVAEKKVISELATVGIYFFSRGRDFINAAIDMIAANDRVNHEFYTCPVYNYMINQGLRIGVYEVSPCAMAGLGTPDDLQSYLKLNNFPESRSAPR